MRTPAGFSPRRGRTWPRLAFLAVAAFAVAACGAGPAASPPPGRPSTDATPYCPRLVVPAFFYPSSIWAQTADSRPPPADIILDISGMGAGPQPDPHFTAIVHQVRARGITILGYISTVDGQRPAAQVETEVRNYRAWYGVTDIFLDRVSGSAPQVAYYRQLAGYIHRFDPGSVVWLNPGDYPDRSYMSIGDVVMVFEGTYAQYLGLQVPAWASDYPPSMFAHTIYAVPGSGLSRTFRLAASRRADHIYVTDGSGDNPYNGLPSYWPLEDSAASAGCAK